MHEPSMQMELIRFVASSKPVVAATKVSERIIKIIKVLLLDPTSAQVRLQTLSLYSLIIAY